MTFFSSLSSPVFSDGNQLLIQFLSDLSLTADGFIGHYKFRPKKFPTTTVPPTTTTQPTTTRPIRKSAEASFHKSTAANILEIYSTLIAKYSVCKLQ